MWRQLPPNDARGPESSRRVTPISRTILSPLRVPPAPRPPRRRDRGGLRNPAGGSPTLAPLNHPTMRARSHEHRSASSNTPARTSANERQPKKIRPNCSRWAKNTATTSFQKATSPKKYLRTITLIWRTIVDAVGKRPNGTTTMRHAGHAFPPPQGVQNLPPTAPRNAEIPHPPPTFAATPKKEKG